MTYPRHTNKQGPERFTAPKATPERNTFKDPLASPGPNSTHTGTTPRTVTPAPKRRGSDSPRRVDPYAHDSATDPVPPVTDATSPGKLRRVTP